MQKYKIPESALAALPVFECAARYLSFTKAAEELHISQSAISRRITNMEALLGIQVFKRNHNKLMLTPQGKELLSAVELGLGHLDKTISQIRNQNKRENFTLACGYSFASLWLQYRIIDFRQKFNELELQWIIADFPVKLNPDEIDVRVLWSKNFRWPEREIRPLLAEDVFPVCSPSFLEKLSLPDQGRLPIEELAVLPLLHCYSSRESNYAGWIKWFQLIGFNYEIGEKDIGFDKYYFAVQAALNGEGIVMGYSGLIDNFLERKELIKIGPTVHFKDEAAYLEFASNRISQSTIDAIYNWFCSHINYQKID